MSSLAPQNVYSVPDGYFGNLAEQVLARIRTGNGPELLSSLPRTDPYEVPAGYFEGLADQVMMAISNRPDYQTTDEELESISPLLNSIRNRPVYTVPEGYFENFKVAGKGEQAAAKVVSFTARKWFRYAAAAVVIGAVAMVGISVYNNNHRDAASRTMARFEKEVKKIDDVKKTDSLIDFMEAGLNEKELASNRRTGKTDDVQQLLQDVSSDELKDFNDQSKDIEDVMMTN